jgi:hypothetical protein
MYENNDTGSGMFVDKGYKWAVTIHLKKYNERINNLDVDGKEILMVLLEKKFDPRLYESISTFPVDYGDELQVTVSGFAQEWDNIPTGFEVEEKIQKYVEKMLDALELDMGFENPKVLEAEQ